MSRVTGHMSHVIISFLLLFDKVVKLFGVDSVINGATPLTYNTSDQGLGPKLSSNKNSLISQPLTLEQTLEQEGWAEGQVLPKGWNLKLGFSVSLSLPLRRIHGANCSGQEQHHLNKQQKTRGICSEFPVALEKISFQYIFFQESFERILHQKVRIC